MLYSAIWYSSGDLSFPSETFRIFVNPDGARFIDTALFRGHALRPDKVSILLCIFMDLITMGYAFRCISILGTVLLTTQKALVLMFLIRSKILMTKKKTSVILVILWLLNIGITIPIGFVYDFARSTGDWCTFTNNLGFWTKIISLMSVLIMVVSTLYISQNWYVYGLRQK